MATATYSALIEKLSGKVGNGVFSNWKGRGVLRCLSSSVSNPRTFKQMANRSELSFLSAYWYGTLNSAQRAQWEEYAQKLSTGHKDNKDIGSAYLAPLYGNLQSGRNAFIAVNLALISAGFVTHSTISVNPPAGGQALDNMVVTFTGLDGAINIDFTMASVLALDLRPQVFFRVHYQGFILDSALNDVDIITAGNLTKTYDLASFTVGHGLNIQTVLFATVAPVLVEIQARCILEDGQMFLVSPIKQVVVPPVSP